MPKPHNGPKKFRVLYPVKRKPLGEPVVIDRKADQAARRALELARKPGYTEPPRIDYAGKRVAGRTTHSDSKSRFLTKIRGAFAKKLKGSYAFVPAWQNRNTGEPHTHERSTRRAVIRELCHGAV